MKNLLNVSFYRKIVRMLSPNATCVSSEAAWLFLIVSIEVFQMSQ